MGKIWKNYLCIVDPAVPVHPGTMVSWNTHQASGGMGPSSRPRRQVPGRTAELLLTPPWMWKPAGKTYNNALFIYLMSYVACNLMQS